MNNNILNYWAENVQKRKKYKSKCSLISEKKNHKIFFIQLIEGNYVNINPLNSTHSQPTSLRKVILDFLVHHPEWFSCILSLVFFIPPSL